jgi:protein gp37
MDRVASPFNNRREENLAGSSEIEWTEATWNPIAGCTIVSPGCTNCYAMRMAARLQAMGMAKYAGTTRKSGLRHVWTGKINVDTNALSAPLTWKKPQRIFVNSMSDLFQYRLDEKTIRRVWRVMESAHWHSFQILTKRPERMLEVLSKKDFPRLPNVWLGASVENAEHLDRIDLLRRVPAHIRFISFEPLLGPILDPKLDGIHWAIVGGESGPRARTMESWWAEELRDSCKRQQVAFFFKQWGGKRKKTTGRLLAGKVWDEYPVGTEPHAGA